MIHFDDKMKKVIKHMQESYNAYNNRKSIIVIKYEDTFNIQNNDTKFINSGKKSYHAICKAIKINNEKCTAKAKPNCEFCGRHMPKKK